MYRSLLTTGKRFYSRGVPVIPVTSAAATPPPPALPQGMWAAVHMDYGECTLFPKYRDALLYVSLILKERRGYDSDLFPKSPRKMSTAALERAVEEYAVQDDKAWVILSADVGKVPSSVGEDEEDSSEEEDSSDEGDSSEEDSSKEEDSSEDEEGPLEAKAGKGDAGEKRE